MNAGICPSSKLVSGLLIGGSPTKKEFLFLFIYIYDDNETVRELVKLYNIFISHIPRYLHKIG